MTDTRAQLATLYMRYTRQIDDAQSRGDRVAELLAQRALGNVVGAIQRQRREDPLVSITDLAPNY